MSIAIFDLDGTITRHDTLFPLVVRWLARRPWQLARLVLVLPATLRFFFDHDRAALKQSLLRATMRGAPRAALAHFASEFVRDTIANRSFHDALSTVRRHRDAGHYLVLMSASVDFYVPEFARQLGFDQVISTGVRWEGDRLDGTLTSANRRGEEKARCLQALLAQRPDEDTYAYGNSASDLPHLRLVRRGMLVNGSLAARREAAELGVACVDWT
ncbi:MAG TPA: HAD-IB family hydrolase [Steroidobacteraceae bacterium]|jgi:HAD superfamily hydrolase (TIGR01490 family)|nr:HAD-IB family hydrolase [Steroidobacteraceae bacterium]